MQINNCFTVPDKLVAVVNIFFEKSDGVFQLRVSRTGGEESPRLGQSHIFFLFFWTAPLTNMTNKSKLNKTYIKLKITVTLLAKPSTHSPHSSKFVHLYQFTLEATHGQI